MAEQNTSSRWENTELKKEIYPKGYGKIAPPPLREGLTREKMTRFADGVYIFWETEGIVVAVNRLYEIFYCLTPYAVDKATLEGKYWFFYGDDIYVILYELMGDYPSIGSVAGGRKAVILHMLDHHLEYMLRGENYDRLQKELEYIKTIIP